MNTCRHCNAEITRPVRPLDPNLEGFCAAECAADYHGCVVLEDAEHEPDPE